MSETARLQHWLCHCRSGALPSWGEQCLKQPKFNNTRAIIVLAGQNSCATCEPLRQRLSSCASTLIFAKFCYRGEVRWTVLSGAKELSDFRTAARTTLRRPHPDVCIAAPHNVLFLLNCCCKVSDVSIDQSSPLNVPLLSPREVSGMWNSYSSKLR